MRESIYISLTVGAFLSAIVGIACIVAAPTLAYMAGDAGAYALAFGAFACILSCVLKGIACIADNYSF